MSEKTAVEQAIATCKMHLDRFIQTDRTIGTCLFTIDELKALAALRASGDVDVGTLKIETRQAFLGTLIVDDDNGWEAGIINQVIDHLASKGVLSRESAWRPIESAPRDGTKFIAINAYKDIFTCYFDNDPEMNCWISQEETGEPSSPPTHWKLLDFPAPPLGDKL